jgi:hypothetical protein
MKKICRPLCMRGGGEYGAPVVLQNLQPRCEIGRVIVARLGGYAEIGAEKRSA